MKEIWMVQTQTFDVDGTNLGDSEEMYYTSFKKAEKQFDHDIEMWQTIGYQLDETSIFPLPFAVLKTEYLIRKIFIRNFQVF